MFKIESAIVQYVVREYNDRGELIGEGPIPPQQFFRATAGDIWAKGEQLVAEAVENAASASKTGKNPR